MEEGYLRLKLKIAPSVRLSTLKALTERLPGTALIADANGTFRLSDDLHLKTLEAFDTLGLTCIEQPLEPDDLLGHRQLAERLHDPDLPRRVRLLARADRRSHRTEGLRNGLPQARAPRRDPPGC